MRPRGVPQQVRNHNKVMKESTWNNGSKVHDEENHNFLEAKRLLITPDKLWTESESI